MVAKVVDISCDMGEAFGQWQLGTTSDEKLMKLISSANIAAGFHAGDPNHMDASIRLALAAGVRIGVHPGYRDLQGFGRRRIVGTAEENVNDIVYQIGALREFARRHDAEIQHVKPHGALYMELAADEVMSKAFVQIMRKLAPEAFIYCMGASATYRAAVALGQPVIREFYADREYNASGFIVLTRRGDTYEPSKLAERVVRACVEGKVRTVDGSDINTGFESICVHSDTPSSVELLEAIHAALSANGIRIAAPSERAENVRVAAAAFGF